MLYRKVEKTIEDHFRSGTDVILLVEGARQTGKSYIIRHVGQSLFRNYIELNFAEDWEGPRLYEQVHSIEDFYFQVSAQWGSRLGSKEDTLIFLDEIQTYPHLITLLKFLRQDGRFTYIASGSMLGLALRQSSSIPIGSIRRIHMAPLDFEEFLIANGYGQQAIDAVRNRIREGESLDEASHNYLLDLFRKYLLIGGLPQAVNIYIETKNIVSVRAVHSDILALYAADASKYEEDSSRRLQIRRIYSMIPSVLENRKKRIVVKDIEGRKGSRYGDYREEFEYLISSGICLAVNAVSNPRFPLNATETKSLLKLYLNDVGLLTGLYYQNNINAVLSGGCSINLGAVYETAAAQELAAHGHSLYYYDNRSNGEVDFLVDDYDRLSVLPIEVKSGRDYTVHSALNRLTTDGRYGISRGIVLSDARQIQKGDHIHYLPIYALLFI